MKKPITDHELAAAEMTLDGLVDEASCADHYRADVLACRRQLRTFKEGSTQHQLLLNQFVSMLFDKYGSFIEDLTDDMPENDLEIYADLEGREYDPDEV